MIELCFEKSIDVIRKNIFSRGIFASPGYHAIWSRDSMITFLGASLLQSQELKDSFMNSLSTLARYQSEKGQIPNAVDRYSRRKPHTDFGSIDSTLWFVIGEHIYRNRYGADIFKRHKTNIDKAVEWLGYQDMGEDGMLEQLPTTDWQDAFPHKYGHAINTQALYCKVLELSDKKKELTRLKRVVNSGEKRLWDKDHYIPWRWKDHNRYHEKGEWFDSLGNLMAIVFGLAEGTQSEKILSFIKKNRINIPFPVRAIHPPITEGTIDWQEYFKDCAAGKPNQYLNGGIWTFIGGFYILALIRQKKFRQAGKELERLAEANIKGKFPEWIHPKTKESFGQNQAWDAGMYMIAYKSVMEKKVLL